MVFMLHDVNDIFMEAAKAARYAKMEMASTVLFVTFALSWFVSRIFYFPAVILRSTLTEPLEVSQTAFMSMWSDRQACTAHLWES